MFFLVVAVTACAKDQPTVLNWPDSGQPILRFTVTKISKIGSFGGQNTFLIDATVENLWNKKIAKATFDFYLFDKSKARISEGSMDLSNLGPGEAVKLQLNASAAGTPVSMTVSPASLPTELSAYGPTRTVAITVYSVPSGAKLKVDGKEVGATPMALNFTIGSHVLEFVKEGFNAGTFPMVVTQDQIAGGSVSYELGTAAHDTVELRDGSVLSADVESVSATSVEVRIGSNRQTLDRNQVKRIAFVQREAPSN
jgi:hypothetical protein